MRILGGLANCHVKGLYSLVLTERLSPEKGMTRIFYVGPEGCDLSFRYNLKGERSLLPHSHRQDVRLYKLAGDIENFLFTESPNGITFNEFQYDSVLLGGKGFTLLREKVCMKETFSQLPTHSGLLLFKEDIHTIVAKPNSAWLVVEGAVIDGPTKCYTFNKNPRLAENLYQPMDSIQLEKISTQLKDLLCSQSQQTATIKYVLRFLGIESESSHTSLSETPEMKKSSEQQAGSGVMQMILQTQNSEDSTPLRTSCNPLMLDASYDGRSGNDSLKSQDLDVSLPIKTRGGFKAVIFATDVPMEQSDYSIVGMIETSTGRWRTSYWTKTGKYNSNMPMPHQDDLMNIWE